MASGIETEVKLRVENADDALERIHALQFLVAHPRIFEANTLYDTPDKSLLAKGMVLRLRQAGESALITWKGPAIRSEYKSRPELETTVGAVETLAAILGQLGYRPTFRYEKYRTEFRAKPAAGHVVLDETPIGTFLELEGEGEWIDQTARRLGFSAADYVLESYGSVYRKHCSNLGVEPGNMVFASL